MFKSESQYNQFAANLAKNMHERSGGKNSINLNFLKALIAESIPDSPSDYNKHKLVNDLRKMSEVKVVKPSHIDSEFSDLLDVSNYSGDLDARGVSHVALRDSKSLVGQIFAESIEYYSGRPCYIDSMLSSLRAIDGDVSHYVNGCLPSENLYIEKVLRTWYDSMAAEICNYITMHGELPLNVQEVERMASCHVADFLTILVNSPNYQELIVAINNNKPISSELIADLSYNENEMISMLLKYYRDMVLPNIL